MKTFLIAWRPRGVAIPTHHFRVEASQWEAFYQHARASRQSGEYYYVRDGGYEEVL